MEILLEILDLVLFALLGIGAGLLIMRGRELLELLFDMAEEWLHKCKKKR